MKCLLVLGIFAPLALGLTFEDHFDAPISSHAPAINKKTSLTLLYQNNLNASDDANHVGAILLDSMGQRDIREACEEIGETMISRQTLHEYRDDFKPLFSFISFARGADAASSYYIRDGVLSVSKNPDYVQLSPFPRRDLKLPVLCTQSSSGNVTTDAEYAKRREVRIMSEGNAYIGLRDKKSFRFLGIPYANTPRRFTNATLYSPKAKDIHAKEYGSSCVQAGGGSEDCLFLNIQTPYLPRRDSRDGLRAVMFWIHGGGFTGGTGSDPLTDGGNLASREDIVVVTFNYRLSTLGFLAIPGTKIRGNYGIADQVLALEWTIKNIAQFGGDPERITIIGESAGAGSVRVLLGSSPASGMFQRAIAMSNLGGGAGLGLKSDYATTYSSYLTIDESYDIAGKKILSEIGCSTMSLDDQMKCLEQVPASTLVGLETVARYVVQDGYYVDSKELNLIKKDDETASIPVMFGNTANDGASFCTYPPSPVKSHLEGLQVALGIDKVHAQSIIDSGLFPYYDTGNMTLDSFYVSQRVATDLQFRCIDQATVFAGVTSGVFQPSYYYQMQRTAAGWDPNKLGGPPATSNFSSGDPNLPYFRLHGSDLPWIFGTLQPLRDNVDLLSAQLVSAYFAEFARSGQPNPPAEYLQARGYSSTFEAVTKFDRWEPVSHTGGPIHLLDYPSVRASFQDVSQCEFLGYPLTHYFHLS